MLFCLDQFTGKSYEQKHLLEYLIECKVTNKCCYQAIYS